MLETLSILVSALALLMALPLYPNIRRARLMFIILALGCGQIHIAVLAYATFMLFESGWDMRPGLSNLGYLWLFILLAGIGITTAVVPTTGRTFSELAQLAVYVTIGLLTLNYLRDGERIYETLQASLFGALAMIMLAVATIILDLQVAPEIFLGRGPNEGAIFLALMGAVPAAVLFVRSRNPLFLGAIGLILVLQFMATARSSMAMTGLAGLGAIFFVSRSKFVRAILIVIGMYLLVKYTPALSSTYESNLNFSARERLALIDYGYWLWEQRPITGWGWGSTTQLAETASTTKLTYPHWHNTFIQLIVESGIVGWAIIATFVASGMQMLFSSFRLGQPQLTTLVALSTLTLAVAGMSEAMLYGADRALQVIVLLCLCRKAVTVGQAEARDSSWLPPVGASGRPEESLSAHGAVSQR